MDVYTTTNSNADLSPFDSGLGHFSGAAGFLFSCPLYQNNPLPGGYINYYFSDFEKESQEPVETFLPLNSTRVQMHFYSSDTYIAIFDISDNYI
jgi:hypothetical protein